MRQRKANGGIPSKYLLTILSIICIMLLFFSYSTGFSGGPLETIANHIFIPMQKGIDYIVTGINTTAKEIYAVKHNAINEDGTVHASVTRHKRTLKYTETPSGAFGIVQGMTSILGQKADINAVALDSFNKSVDSRVSITGFKDIGLFAQPTVDRRSTGVWS